MSKFNKETQKSVRVVLPLKLYEEVKEKCLDYGDLSRLVRHLLKGWLESKGTIRQVYNETDEKKYNREFKESLDDEAED